MKSTQNGSGKVQPTTKALLLVTVEYESLGKKPIVATMSLEGAWLSGLTQEILDQAVDAAIDTCMETSRHMRSNFREYTGLESSKNLKKNGTKSRKTIRMKKK